MFFIQTNQSSFRLNESYYLDSFPYTSYNTNTYSFRQQNQSNVYFSTPPPPPPPPTTTNQFNTNHSDMINYTNYESTYLNVAVATSYQSPYSNNNNTINDSFDMNFSRHINELYGNNEQIRETDVSDRKISTTVQSNRKRKFQDDTMSRKRF